MIRPKAIDVEPYPDYCLLVTFSNNEKRLFDVKPYLDFKPFNELRNITLFNTVKPAGLSVGCTDRIFALMNFIITAYLPHKPRNTRR